MRRVRRLRTEGDVDEVTLARRRRLGAEAVQPRRVGAQRGRDQGQDRCVQEAFRLAQAEPAQRGIGDREQRLAGVDRRVQVDADLHGRHAEPLRRDGGGELARLPHDQVWRETLDGGEHPRQRGRRVEADEQLLQRVHEPGRLWGEDRRPRRRATGRQVQARQRQLAAWHGRGQQDGVPGRQGGTGERQQRADMPAPWVLANRMRIAHARRRGGAPYSGMRSSGDIGSACSTKSFWSGRRTSRGPAPSR